MYQRLRETADQALAAAAFVPPTKDKTMDDGKWEAFFDLLDKIVVDAANIGGWEAQAAIVKAKAEEFGSEGNLTEFANWFPPEE